MTTAFDYSPPIEIDLSAFRELHTRNGPCLLRTGSLEDNEEFWKHWRQNRLAWAERGFSVRKAYRGDIWEVQQWLTHNYQLTELGREIVANLRAEAQDEIEFQEAIENWEPSHQLVPEHEAKLFDYQVRPAQQLLNGLYECNGALDASELGTGKAQPLNSKILTPDGWTTMGELKVGDVISTSERGTQTVVAIYPQGEQPVYRIKLNGERHDLVTRSTLDHLWDVRIDGTEIVLPLSSIISIWFSGCLVEFPVSDSFSRPKWERMKHVSYYGKLQCQCIAVSHPSRLYVTDDFIITHNTYTSLAAALSFSVKVGVICPLAVIPAWKQAFRHFGTTPVFIKNYESLRTGRKGYVVRDKKRFEWKVDDDTILIFDEAHNLKNGTTLNANLALAALRQKIPCIGLSGTLAKDPTEMFATGQFVGLHSGHDYDPGGPPTWAMWLRRHGCKQEGSKWVFGKRKSALVAIHRQIFPMRGARVVISELGDRFPETQIICQAYETGQASAIDRAYREAQDYARKLEQQGRSEFEVKGALAKGYIKARRESEELKIPVVIQLVEEERQEGRHVAIFCNFTRTRELLMDALKTKCGIYGGQPAWDRERQIAAFQADSEPVIVSNIEAGGVGVSLHDTMGEHPRTAIIFPSPKAIAMKQALGRVHRAGGLSRSRQIVMFAAGTVEEQICEKVREQLQNIDALNDGDLNPGNAF